MASGWRLSCGVVEAAGGWTADFAAINLTKRSGLLNSLVVSKTRKILDRIEQATPGWVFTPSDMFDLASAHLVGMVLLRLVRAGRIRRLRRGLYDVPRSHAKLGVLMPTVDAIAQAIARRDGVTLRESEAVAANLLRLSEQVPAQIEFQTDGRSQEIVVGRQRIQLRRRSPRRMRGVAESSARVISGLRSLGAGKVENAQIELLRGLLTRDERSLLLVDLRRAPRWMHRHLRAIAQGDVRGDGPQDGVA